MEQRTRTNKGRAAAAILAVALLLAVAVGGVSAWLMDSSSAVLNIFGTSHVTVQLAETGAVKNADGSFSKSYRIVPGMSEGKDPVVSGTASVPVGVYVKVDDTTQGLVTYAIADGWLPLERADGTRVAGVWYREFDPGTAGTTEYSYHVLATDSVSYAAALTNESLAAKSGTALTFTAYVSQQAEFADAASAYDALMDQTGSGASGA